MRSIVIYTVSLGVHLALGASFATVKRPEKRVATAIALREVKVPPKAPPPPPPAPPPEAAEPAPPKRAPRPARPAPAAPAPAEAPAPSASAPVADLGLTLGGASGPGGVAVPVGEPRDKAPVREKKVARALEAAPPSAAACAEGLVKAKPLEVLQPAYTEEARAAQIEGKVRVEITVGADGTVKDARIIQGLGSGLDEAALAAARGSRFQAAMECGNPVQSTFVIGIRFTL